MGRLLLVLMLLGGTYYIVSYLLAGLRSIVNDYGRRSPKNHDSQLEELLREVAQLRKKLDEQ